MKGRFGKSSAASEQGLSARTGAIANHEPTTLVVLTRQGKALLDGYSDAGDARQRSHAALVKPRELGHDVQLYRMTIADIDTEKNLALARV